MTIVFECRADNLTKAAAKLCHFAAGWPSQMAFGY
jgi:hypothetical protein